MSITAPLTGSTSTCGSPPITGGRSLRVGNATSTSLLPRRTTASRSSPTVMPSSSSAASAISISSSFGNPTGTHVVVEVVDGTVPLGSPPFDVEAVARPEPESSLVHDGASVSRPIAAIAAIAVTARRSGYDDVVAVLS